MRSEPDDQPLFRRAATAVEAEQIARDLGAIADYAGQVRIGNAVNEALAILRELGVEVPVSIRVDPLYYAMGGSVQRDVVGTYDERDDIIRFNPFARHWSDPARGSRVQYELRWWATDHPLAPVFHEVGHALHLSPAIPKTNPVRDWASDQERRIARRVSLFAETAPTEFVAEVFTVLVTGGIVDQAVRRLYQRFGGIVP